MARQTFRLNLTAAEFPLLSDNYGRSIVYPQQDMHYIRPNAFTGTEADRNIGIPQMTFCENVLPTTYGVQSVSYSLAVNGSAVTSFDQAMYLRDVADNRTLFSPGVVGTTANRYTYNASTQLWSSSPVGIPSGAKATIANIKNRTIIKYAFDPNFYEWNGAWSVLVLPAITPANILGITYANAYLILYDTNTIYWSATNDITDFVPSLVTGAGSQRALSIKGNIVVCYPIDDGFIIYTTQNVVVARYSGNTRFPWTYKEIKNSSGLRDPEHACAAGESNNYYQYSVNGLMVNTLILATQQFTIVNEFLGTRFLEVWGKVNNVITQQNLTAPMQVKIQFLANRWLIISYGPTIPFTYALVYDTALKRWGKLRITHVDCFDYYGDVGNPGAVQTLTWQQLTGTWTQQIGTWSDYGGVIVGGQSSLTVLYKSIGFLGNDGSVRVVNFDMGVTNDDAVMIIGKIQFLRDRLWTISEIEIEGMAAEAQTKLLLQCSMDGYNVQRQLFPYKSINKGKMQKWLANEVALNHQLVIKGNFDLKSVVVRGHNAGRR